MMNDFVTTKEAAGILSVSTVTIHKYVKEGILTPLDEDKWQIDRTKMFKKEDVVYLKKKLQKPGYTTGEVAAMLKIHPSSVGHFIKTGELIAEKKTYKQREMYFISEAEYQRFQKSYMKQKKQKGKDFYNRQKGFGLFQPFRSRNSGEFGRIISLDGENGTILTNYDRSIPINKIEEEGFEKILQIKDLPYINKRGYAHFTFKMPHDLNSSVFKIIDMFYQTLSPRNMKMNYENDEINIEVKSVFLPINIDLYKNEIALMEQSIREGSIQRRHNGIFISSEKEYLQVGLPLSLKKKIKDDASLRKISMEQVVLDIVERHYSDKETKINY